MRLDPPVEDKESHMARGLNEEQDGLADDIDLEMDALNATLMETGVDKEAEDEFQTLSEEEAEQVSRAQEEQTLQEEDDLVNGEADNEKGTGGGDLATRQGSRKRLFKPTINTA
ncbi:hypothetical protein Bca52824_074163 [Brassica carinata]|uniref:Uncharacterized protein n=1 Tax=Brassica carinata TaxID=52824 RepID=A0A8X7QGL3_BRACI|nr:hypothetical protein Bca52824_074163 [Brassica carinata]